MKVFTPPLRLIDRLLGVTPTIANWDTDPTNLANATDDDWDTATGVGQENGVAGYVRGSAYFQFDMGAVYNVLLFGRLIVGNTLEGGQGAGAMLATSIDGSTYREYHGDNDSWCGAWCDNEDDIVDESCIVHARYIRIYPIGWGGSETNIRLAIYELKAFDFDV